MARMIEITAVGGYNEVGRNMTAVNVDGETVIFDMGVYLDNYIPLNEDNGVIKLSTKKLIEENAVPDIERVADRLVNVVAIVPTHAHLDHLGAVPFLEKRFNAPIIMTPYTHAVLKVICKDQGWKLKNQALSIPTNTIYKLTDSLELEFINMTHSTPQTAAAALHTQYGTIIYANDFKLDNSPVLGKPPDYERLKELGKEGVLCLISDSTYAAAEEKTPSEALVGDMLRDVLLRLDNKGAGIIITTFSSHIARLKTIIETCKKLNRKIVLLGRSLWKYTEAAKMIGLVNFEKEGELKKYPREIEKALKKISKEGKDKYVIICTGHQGEPNAVLSKLVNNVYDYRLTSEDHVIFSCKVIPSPISIQNRKILDSKLKERGVHLFKNIHVSGHAAKEDLRELVDMLKPQHIIPAHGDMKKRVAFAELGKELGYGSGTIHLLSNGESVGME